MIPASATAEFLSTTFLPPLAPRAESVRLPPLPALRTLRLRVVLRALEPALLPPFHGSMLRGAFGHAFRRAACVVAATQACASCRLRPDCAYAQVFETPIEPGQAPRSLRGQVAAPHAYLFEVGSLATELRAGDPLAFDLLLIGRAIEAQARIFWAIERMGGPDHGLGARRARFALDSVDVLSARGTTIPLHRDGAWLTDAAPSITTSTALRGEPLASAPLPGDGGRVRLHFATPLRLRRDQRLVPPRDPRDLVYSMLRRVHELAYFHGPASERRDACDFRPTLNAASALTARDWRFSFVSHQRYSNRQTRPIDLSGHLGSPVLEGDLAPLAPLLRAAETLHVGKGTVHGLGWFRLEAVA